MISLSIKTLLCLVESSELQYEDDAAGYSAMVVANLSERGLRKKTRLQVEFESFRLQSAASAVHLQPEAEPIDGLGCQ